MFRYLLMVLNLKELYKEMFDMREIRLCRMHRGLNSLIN